MADWRPMLKRREDGFPRIMGVVNVTPDSFHARSRSSDINHAVETAMKMASEGADWIDIGGESTRPGASPVTIEDELSRVIPAIEAIRSQLPDVCISIDTRRSEVAMQALNSGADMVNDVSAMSDPGMLSVVSEHDCPVCIMHMRGLPENMQDDPSYDDVVREVRGYLGRVAELLMDEGVKPSQIVADPGIGFGKTLEHNIALLSSGRSIVPDERMSLMWGVSRKSMFLDLLGREDSEDRLAGTLGVAAISPEKEVDIIRVHDVAEHSDSFEAMKAVQKHMPQFEMPEMAFTREEKEALLRKIKEKSHGDTHEGVVLWSHGSASRPIKAKIKSDHDVYDRSIIQDIDKHGKQSEAKQVSQATHAAQAQQTKASRASKVKLRRQSKLRKRRKQSKHASKASRALLAKQANIATQAEQENKAT